MCHDMSSMCVITADVHMALFLFLFIIFFIFIENILMLQNLKIVH